MRFSTLAWFFACPYCVACGDESWAPRERAAATPVKVQAGSAGALSVAGAGGGGGGSAQLELSCELELPFVHETGRGFWLGSDGAHSLALSSSRALVSFPDSFVGAPTKLNRVDADLVANSVALVSCADGESEVEYAWGGAGHEHAALFDDDTSDDVQLRPRGTWLTAGELFLAATRVTQGDAGPVEHGSTLIRVSSPLAPVREWSVEYFELSARAAVGIGVADGDMHVFLFTAIDGGIVLTRIAKDRLLEPSLSENSLETLRDDGAWVPGFELSRARRLALPAAKGLTVRRHAPSGRWLALFTNTSVWPSASISVSSALSIEGPWSTPTLIYAPPEMNPLAAEYRSDWFCYGAAEHAAFNALADRELLFSYACSSTNLARVIENTSAFVPRLARLAIPLAF